MKNPAIIATFLLSCLATATSAEPLVERLTSYLCQTYQLERSSIDVSIVSNQLRISDTGNDSLQIKPMTDGAPKGLFSLWCQRITGDSVRSSGQVTLRVRTFAPALTAVRSLPMRTELSPDDVALTRIETTTLYETPVTDLSTIVDMRTRRLLQPGAVLTTDALEPVPVIRTGQEVVISFHSGAVSITTSGQALQNGSVGDLIRVRNRSTGKQIVASVVDSREVRVN